MTTVSDVSTNFTRIEIGWIETGFLRRQLSRTIVCNQPFPVWVCADSTHRHNGWLYRGWSLILDSPSRAHHSFRSISLLAFFFCFSCGILKLIYHDRIINCPVRLSLHECIITKGVRHQYEGPGVPSACRNPTIRQILPLRPAPTRTVVWFCCELQS
jgi:hypothetical protein